MKNKFILTAFTFMLLFSIKLYSQEPMLAEIKLFAGNFAPRGWAFCDGQLLPIAQNQALFSILGTIYGGDGRTTFALPDLRGRAPIGPRTGPGLTTYREGQRGGVEQVYLSILEMPNHSHTPIVNAAAPVGRGQGKTNPTGNYWADDSSYSATKNTQMAADAVAVGNTGGSQSHENRQPYIALNYIIAIQGTFPSRN